jgi:hypothetical protein
VPDKSNAFSHGNPHPYKMSLLHCCKHLKNVRFCIASIQENILCAACVHCLRLAVHVHCLRLADHVHCLRLADHVHCLRLADHVHCLRLADHVHCLRLADHVHCLRLAAHVRRLLKPVFRAQHCLCCFLSETC